MSKSKFAIATLCAILLITYSCKKEGPGILNGLSRSFISTTGCNDTTTSFAPLNYGVGATTLDSIMIDTARSFKLYVPSSYDSTEAHPMVIMFHGSGQSAQKMIDNTTWSDEAETEGFIMVYPNAVKYLVDGSLKSKWRTEGTLAQVDPGVVMRDDIEFVKNMIKKIYGTLNINCNKIYACGFSNGGNFIKSELRIHLDNAFAATASAGGMGSQSVMTPDHGRHMPHFELLGSKDANKLVACGVPQLPFTSDSIINSPCVYDQLDSMRVSMSLDTNRIAIDFGAPDVYAELKWDNSTLAQNTEYKFIMLKGMTHVFPSRKWNVDYVPIIYAWFDSF